MPKSTFYYKPSDGRRGRKEYAQYFDNEGNILSNGQVVLEIKKLFENPFVDYGCFKTYVHLRDNKGFSVSKHKVYNLMKKYGLLRKRYTLSSKKGKRVWVTDLIPKTSGAFSYFEVDIKFMWVKHQKRNAQVLSIIDVETRMVLGQFIAYRIRKKDVEMLIGQMINIFGLPTSFTLRNDNGSQFIAQSVQDFLLQKGIRQEFTKPATPQQNAHIESFHSIMERAVCQRFEFKDINDLTKTLVDFVDFYNFERIHSATGYMSPFKYFLQKEEEKPSPHLKSVCFFLTQNYENYLNKVSNI